LTELGAASSNVGLVDDNATWHDEENVLRNNSSPRRNGSLMKSRGGTKRKSPSRGLGGVLCQSTPPSPPALRTMRQIAASPPSKCKGNSNGFFGQALTFAARSMQHTVNQLQQQQWAKELDLGVKSFTSSILVLNRTSNSREGFVFPRRVLQRNLQRSTLQQRSTMQLL
jgi:hypothetical protein